MFEDDVRDGLLKEGQKTLPPVWFYDDVGSALFEAITVLPEYGLSRADCRLLEQHAKAIVNEARSPALIVELGSGVGSKTRHLLGASENVVYRPIDISAAALRLCDISLEGMDNVTVEPIEADYDEGLTLALQHRHEDRHALLLFLGSTIGNFSRPEALEFLRMLRGHLRPGDRFLLGADLVKDREALLLAYDDPTGVTAAFNKNLLARINRDLAGEFDLRCFEHEARFNEEEGRVEMHLRSTVDQCVKIGALNAKVKFEKGETIWTESSHKFSAAELIEMGERAGWHYSYQWIDEDWGFAETLFVY